MPEPEHRQRVSFWGVAFLLIVGGITYLLIERGHFLLLYALATGALCLFLIIVAFDIGLEDRGEGE